MDESYEFEFDGPEVYAVFFDDPDAEHDETWVMDDRLHPQSIINDRINGGDTSTGCWVRNWRLVDHGN